MAARLIKRSDTLYDIVIDGVMSATGCSADRVVASADGSTLTITRGAKSVVLQASDSTIDIVQDGVRKPYYSNNTVHGDLPPI